MTADLRRRELRRAVTDLIAFESELGASLERNWQLLSASPEALAALEHFRPIMQAQRDRLATYLKDIECPEPDRAETRGAFTFTAAVRVSEAWRDISVAFNYGAASYAILYEMALRLYEPALREIAPKHLKAHVDAASTVIRLLPALVAWELAQDGLHCSCICPMCGLGACGCVALGTQTLGAAWRETIEAKSPLPGFGLQPPKPESELARTGVRGGERLLAVDGQEVHSVAEIQATLRKHALGEEVRLLVQRGSEPPRELGVRHVSDYPKT